MSGIVRDFATWLKRVTQPNYMLSHTPLTRPICADPVGGLLLVGSPGSDRCEGTVCYILPTRTAGLHLSPPALGLPACPRADAEFETLPRAAALGTDAEAHVWDQERQEQVITHWPSSRQVGPQAQIALP